MIAEIVESHVCCLASEAQHLWNAMIHMSNVFACCCNMVDEMLEYHVCRVAYCLHVVATLLMR